MALAVYTCIIRIFKTWWRSTPILAAMLLVLSSLLPQHCLALGGRVDLSCGYDDNVAASTDKQGSPFMRYQVQLYQPLVDRPALYVEGYGWASYDAFTRLEDRREFLLGASCLRRWQDGLWHSLFYVEGRSYRDDLVGEDEFDALEVGCQVERFINEQISLGVSGYCRYADYRQGYNWVSTVYEETETSGGQGNGNGSNGQTTTQETLVEINESRHDREFGIIGQGEYRFTADLFCDVKVFYQDNDSTLSWESYQGYGVEHGWQMFFTSSVSGELWGSWLARDYDKSDDRQWTAAVRLDWQWQKNLSAYVQMQQVWQNSDFSDGDYTKKVAICGLYWLF
ncbi:hypothetical protein HTZ97_11895 [Desulfuromonas acetoxidans]|uniref:Uncharacterized protein n=1 Tax=Desulfuromonas acetoxidans (strain DSM 684 / 11070) TaxID=281689 RepID=Q1JZD2_DESA6|nr:hypothetical protein [Desulfuromonas acetoxidans]EAT15635.1 hypothetical protein Dace_1497 [Desulfuromonas acetoxidans DSM 684]MBF0645738.1 hypothetical protein [Desulfuromonas acetoxidans]NVD25228.1 hypothetical protein [Desulfuromonas acetoxidans]NVE17150.1 hypothetical protein [Desulfuromonas acetoxidans]